MPGAGELPPSAYTATDVTSEAATYRRLRAALVAARDKSAVTVLVGSTELNLPDAATYAQNHLLLEGMHGVRIAQRVGLLEIAPERRTGSKRRSGLDRRSTEQAGGLWAERRSKRDRRAGVERRVPIAPVWEAAAGS
jgi:hypothetical protein